MIITPFMHFFGLYIIYFDHKSVAIHPPPIEVAINKMTWGDFLLIYVKLLSLTFVNRDNLV